MKKRQRHVFAVLSGDPDTRITRPLGLFKSREDADAFSNWLRTIKGGTDFPFYVEKWPLGVAMYGDDYPMG